MSRPIEVYILNILYKSKVEGRRPNVTVFKLLMTNNF